jgi:ribonuclease BN (tRNA processing enzyme)
LGRDDGPRRHRGTFRPPWFPISIDETPAQKAYVDLVGQDLHIGGLVVSHDGLAHPQGVLAYRIDHDGRSVVIATDTERGDAASDAALARLARDVDVLIHDAQYTPEEYAESYEGWGHSTWSHAVDAAVEAGARRLVLTSHDPERSDEAVDGIVALARSRFASTEAGYEGLVIEI